MNTMKDIYDSLHDVLLTEELKAAILDEVARLWAPLVALVLEVPDLESEPEADSEAEPEGFLGFAWV